jgi:hypothetical protein
MSTIKNGGGGQGKEHTMSPGSMKMQVIGF